VAFLDHQYDWDSPYKTQIISGLVDWLGTKVSLSSLQQIIIAGHSRGGCLALGLAREFRARAYAYNSVRILGAPIDGTCQDSDREMGTSSGGTNNIDNPPETGAPNDWYAWNSIFTTRDNRSVCIQNTVGGEPQALVLNIHSFFLANPAWHNSWLNIPHFINGQCTDNSISDDDCRGGGSFNVQTDVLDRALRFVEINRVHSLSLTPPSLVNGVVGSAYS